MNDNTFFAKRNGIAFALLLLLVFLVYSNTFNAAWHMDDTPNITSNSRLHVETLSHGSILKTFFAHPDGRKQDSLYRPVACLTFALNWYFGKDNVTVPASQEPFEAYNISIFGTDLGNIYYSPEAGNIIKISGNFQQLLPSVSNINAELVAYEYTP